MEFLSNLHHIDKNISLAINSLHCPLSDSIWLLFSHKQIWFILYVIVMIFLFRHLGWKKALIAILSVILTVICCDQLANFTKAYFERLRPCCDGIMLSNGLRCLQWHRPVEYGFYSAHAANAMGFAIGTYQSFRIDKTRSYRTYGILVITWALLVGMSRVFVGMHFLGDVITGLAVGSAIAYIWSITARYSIKMIFHE